MPPYKIIEYNTLIILLFLLVNTFFIIFIKKILDIKKIEVYKGVESEVKMTVEEKFIYETEIKVQALKEALAVVKEYPTKDFMIAALEGKIEGNERFINDLKEGVENAKRNIL